MDSREIRRKFLLFFESRGHKIVQSSSLVPDDGSVLFTTAGMQQFKKYYTGELDAEKKFGSKNTASIQKCFRTSDIGEVGDESHLTFFEMLGNFSFGGYFKDEAINYAYEFLTKEMGLSIDYVTVFKGDKDIPKDKKSELVWNKIGVPDIREYGKEDNFWGPTGDSGPCGPTTEIYIKSQGGDSIEVWNIVFNEYYRGRNGDLEKLSAPGVDTGMGLERLAVFAENRSNIFETDLFLPIIELLPDDLDIKSKRIVADHIRAVVFLVADGIVPSNKDRGYVLRRIMRRIIAKNYVAEKKLGLHLDIERLFKETEICYKSFYPEIDGSDSFTKFLEEKDKFDKAFERGVKELNKLVFIDAKSAFKIYESFGIPYEVIKDISGDRGVNLNSKDFEREFARHQDVSRAGAEKKFGGHGLLGKNGEVGAKNSGEINKITRLHTATHLLQAALREILGKGVMQMGSDINYSRTRFDFSFNRKLTPEEIKAVEKRVNEKIKEDIPVNFVEMSKEDAEKSGALHFFNEKYPDKVKVYYIGDSLSSAYSKEFCGGPHVKSTGEIGEFKILKQESVGAGIKRIKATVEP